MGSQSQRYRRPSSEHGLHGICAKVLAWDAVEDRTVLMKSGRGPAMGHTREEYRAAVAARACGVPVVVGTWARSDFATGDVRPHYVIPMIEDAVEVGSDRDWTRQQQIDFLHITAFAYVTGEGDRHGGNQLLTEDGRMLAIDMAFPGYNRGMDVQQAVSLENVELPDITVHDVVAVANQVQAGREAIEWMNTKIEMPMDGWERRMKALKTALWKWVKEVQADEDED